MCSSASTHLPTEVVINIAELLFDLTLYQNKRNALAEDNRMERQHTFYNFCLVSRQWYSAGVEYLYRHPQLSSGNRFVKFGQTICPSVSSIKSKVDLGSMVQCLLLGDLVHQSSNSMTARLLSRTSKKLSIYEAPRVSFAYVRI